MITKVNICSEKTVNTHIPSELANEPNDQAIFKRLQTCNAKYLYTFNSYILHMHDDKM